MNKISYSGYRFPPEIIQQAIWLYLRFTLSLRDVEDLLAERGVAVSYETVRRWVNHFGPTIAAVSSARAASDPLILEPGALLIKPASESGVDDPWEAKLSATSSASPLNCQEAATGQNSLANCAI